jgi:hypothetical protein
MIIKEVSEILLLMGDSVNLLPLLPPRRVLFTFTATYRLIK